MICSSCRRTFITQLYSSVRSQTKTPSLSPTSHLRYASTVPATPNAAPMQPPPSMAIEGANPNPTKSSASPSASQPLSDAHMPSTSSAKPKTQATSEIRKPRKLQSSVAAGYELRGLGYTKAKPLIKAKEDHEYPDWLWTLLDDSGKLGETKVDLSAMTKKQRARYDKAQEKILAKIPVQIPVHEQSKDLTGPEDNAITSLERRREIIRSARSANRKNIREANFLKSM